MTIVQEKNHINTAEEATSEVEKAGFYGMTIDQPPNETQPHWHNFNSTLYILEGTLNITDVNAGIVYTCEAGWKITVPENAIHAEKHQEYKAVIGLSVDPMTLQEPIDRLPEDLKECG